MTLTSVPVLPPDEVLAQLPFNRSAASLGALELAQLAGALAELSGATCVSPLELLRAKLGLIGSVGAGTNGAAASVAGGPDDRAGGIWEHGRTPAGAERRRRWRLILQGTQAAG